MTQISQKGSGIVQILMLFKKIFSLYTLITAYLPLKIRNESMNDQLRIIFMGTPSFAVATLDILVKSNYNVVAVITSTDKYGGRGGKKLLQSDVKKYAIENGIPILQPKNLKHPDFVEELRSFKADLQIVVAFRMLPEVVWNMPRLGTYNLHGSLLPKYRGAAPINWAIINGDTETGVTSFKLKHEIDTGSIAVQKRMTIGENATAGEVHDEMMQLGAEAVLETVLMIESDQIVLKEQTDAEATKAPKIFTNDCKIDFEKGSKEVHDFIRGLSPYPVAWTTIDDKKHKIYRTLVTDTKAENEAGLLTIRDNKLLLSTKENYLEVLEIQVEGKRKMAAKDYVNGYLSRN